MFGKRHGIFFKVVSSNTMDKEIAVYNKFITKPIDNQQLFRTTIFIDSSYRLRL